MEAFVTSGRHPVCPECLEVWMQKQISENLNCRCPATKDDLEAAEAEEGKTIEIGGKHIRAQKLEMAQPLAYILLQSIQVKCTEDHCYWIGDYGELKKHLVEHNLTTVRTPQEQEQNQTVGADGAVPPQFTYDDASRVGTTTRGDPTAAHHGPPPLTPPPTATDRHPRSEKVSAAAYD